MANKQTYLWPWNMSRGRRSLTSPPLWTTSIASSFIQGADTVLRRASHCTLTANKSCPESSVRLAAVAWTVKDSVKRFAGTLMTLLGHFGQYVYMPSLSP